MTDLKDLLAAVADRADPIDDLADRAVTRAVRRRRRALIAGPVLAAALAAAALLVPNQLSHRGLEPVRPTPSHTARPVTGVPQVDIRTEDQPALPAKLAQPALLAYAVACSHDMRCTNPWRLLTADGKQWNLTDAAGNGPDTGAVSVAPNGKRIAYLSKHRRNGSGYLVVRDLATGAADRPVEVPASVVDQYKPSIAWSPDSRWLGLDFRLAPHVDTADSDADAILVDTTTMALFPLPYPCCLAGLPTRTANWIPVVPPAVGGLGADRALRLDWSGEVSGEMSAEAGDAISSGWGQTLVSPDGSVLATINYPDGEGELAVVDPESGAVSSRRRLGGLGGLGGTTGATFELLGWTGPHTVLALTVPGESTAGVYSIDIRTGTARLTYQLTHQPDRLSVATKVRAGGSR